MQHGSTLSRRRMLALTGAVSTGGIAYLITQSDDAAAASVSMDGFTLQESEHTVGTVESVTLTIPVEYEYTSPINVATVRLGALAGDSLTSLEPYDSVDIPVDTNEGSGSHMFDVDLLSSWHFSASAFEATDGSTDVLVAAGVRMALLDADGETVTETTDDDAGQMTVHPSGSIEAAFASNASVVIS